MSICTFSNLACVFSIFLACKRSEGSMQHRQVVHSDSSSLWTLSVWTLLSTVWETSNRVYMPIHVSEESLWYRHFSFWYRIPVPSSSWDLSLCKCSTRDNLYLVQINKRAAGLANAHKRSLSKLAITDTGNAGVVLVLTWKTAVSGPAISCMQWVNLYHSKQ